MKIIKPTPLGILTRTYRSHGREHLGIAIPVMATLGATPRLVSESELWNTVGEELAGYPLDAALPKSHAEFLVSANAYGKYCDDTHACHVGIRFAGVEKQLRVSGDREWQGDSVTAAKAFDLLPIDWPHAYGGAGCAENPAGRGFSNLTGDDGRAALPSPLPSPLPFPSPLPLPNIEYAANLLTKRGQHVAPAALTPIAPGWPQRSTLFGQLDPAWREQDCPGFPRTMDPHYFNVAPSDQQLPAHAALPDGAAYEITRLHPEREVIAGILPALRARSFIRRRQANVLTELAMHLTTAWFIPHRERVVMIFHGVAEIEEFDARDVDCLLLAAESTTDARTAEHYQRVLELRIDHRHGALHALRDGDLMPASIPAATCDETGMPDDPSQHAWQRNMQNRTHSLTSEAALSAQHAGVRLDPVAIATAPAPPRAPRLDELADFVQRQEQQAADQRAALDKMRRQIDADYAAHCPPPPPRRGPPKLSHHAPSPAHPEQAGLDDIAREADLKLREAYRYAAHLQEPAARLDSHSAAAHAIRERVAALHASGESLAGLDLTGADLSGLSLRGAQLSGALLENADLTGTDLDNANLSDALLVRTTLTRATLRGANLSRANLSLAHCDDTDFSDATLDAALFERTQFHRCTLRRTSIERAHFRHCRFDTVDFSEATLSDLVFIEQTFQHVDFSQARIRKLALIQCAAEHVSFSDADIHGFGCIDTAAAGIRFDRARLRQACFVKDSVLDHADFSHATLSEVNLRQVSAKGANFSHARISQCDFSDACLQTADLQRVRVENGYLVRADLRGATLARADLVGSYLRGADLRGANLREANLFRANLAEVLLDATSPDGLRAQLDGAYLEQTVFHPIAQEPA